MVIVKLLIDISVYKGLKLEKGDEYVMSGAVMKQLLRIYPGGIYQTENFEDLYKGLKFGDLKDDGSEVFIFRSGGIGDVMFMLPLIKHIKKTYPSLKIKVGTSPMYVDVFENNPHVFKVVQMPFSLTEFKKSDHHLIFEGLIEDNPEKSQILSAIDLFLDKAEIDFSKIDAGDKIPELYITEEERSYIKGEIFSLGVSSSKKKVGIQIEASSPIRTFPFDKMVSVIKKMMEVDVAVFLFGGKNQSSIGNYLSEIFLEEKNFKNLILPDKPLREAILYASAMDVIVAPDSAFIHIAGGLKVPVVGLYGCFPSLLRMKYYKNAIGIDCNVICAPSFLHGHSPCEKGSPSPCFSVVSVENIIDAVDHLLGGKKIQMNYPVYNEFIKGELIETPFSTLNS
jgi:ADP-heptose:LPS heptosyltransferase